MKQQRANTGPFLRRIYYEQRDVESLCATALADAGLMPETPSPVRIDRFVEKHFRVEVRATEMKPGLMGAIRFDDNGKVLGVFVSAEIEADTSDSGRRRFRSTVGHEAGHGLLHAPLFAEKLLADGSQYDFVSGGDAGVRRDGFMCRPEENGTGRKYEWWEFQANMAMSCLLLPWKLITAAADPFRARYAEVAPTEREAVAGAAALQLAETFDVNPVMIRYRLKDWWKEALQLSLL